MTDHRYTLSNPAMPVRIHLFDSKHEADLAAAEVRRDRRPRMGLGRIKDCRPYQTRMAGRPWAVEVKFLGTLWYECGKTRRNIGGSTRYIAEWKGGTDD